jgi:hypothetical protein
LDYSSILFLFVYYVKNLHSIKNKAERKKKNEWNVYQAITAFCRTNDTRRTG